MVESSVAAAPGASDHEARMLRMQDAVRTLIRGIGEDLEREGLRDTPKRVAKAFMELSVGYRQDIDSVLNNAIFHEEEVGTSSTGIVLVRDIDFAGLSEETLLPFYGRCHVAYLPSGGAVLGLSKLARITKLFAKRLQTQQRLGQQVLQCLQQQLAPLGVAVLVQAQHLGFGGEDVSRLTAAASGLFASEGSLQLQELLLLLGLDEQPLELCRVEQPSAGGKGAGGAGPPAISLTASSSAAPGIPAPAAAGAAAAATGGLLASLALDSVEAPATPDPSEGDEEAPVAEVELEEAAGGEEEAAVSPCCGSPGAVEAMEAAVAALLREMGEEPRRPALRAAARRYVAHLLASTAGYRQQLRPAPDPAAAPASAQHASSSSSSSSSSSRRTEHSTPDRAQQQRLAAGEQAAEGAAERASASAPGAELELACSSSGGSSRHRQLYQPASMCGSTVHHFSSSFASQCEHHMLPFQGSVHIALVQPAGATPPPAEQLQQLVAVYTRRLQLQERITHQLLHGAQQLGRAAGVMVVVEAAHMCMVARGVENHSGSTLSSATLGCFSGSAPLRAAVIRRVRQQLAAQHELQAAAGECGDW